MTSTKPRWSCSRCGKRTRSVGKPDGWHWMPGMLTVLCTRCAQPFKQNGKAIYRKRRERLERQRAAS